MPIPGLSVENRIPGVGPSGAGCGVRRRRPDERVAHVKVSPVDDFEAWIAALAERRPFGPSDRLGTANYIDENARRRAADM